MNRGWKVGWNVYVVISRVGEQLIEMDLKMQGCCQVIESHVSQVEIRLAIGIRICGVAGYRALTARQKHILGGVVAESSSLT